jgi:beta-lactamase regulating signal transducer with metallopeptidase domain
VAAQQIAQPFPLENSNESPSEPAVSVPSEPVKLDFTRSLFALWACGCATVLTLWLIRWMRVRAAVNSAKPLQFEAPIPVRASSSHLEPGVVGIVRPILLLPEGIAAHLTPEELRAIVAHEVCHLRRQDNLTAAIHMLVEAIFWFYPLVWWLGARLIDERERACDEAVVRSGNDPEVYAEGILKVCRFYVAAPVACAAGVTGADLKKRIESIMTHRLTVQLTLAKKVMLAAAFCVLALIVFEGSGSAVRAQDAAFSGRALVFRDIPSWNRHPDFEDVLRDLAFQYDAKPSSDMSRTELSQYAFIVIPGAQWGTNYYKAFADNAPVLDRYVRDGGTLVVEMNGAERALFRTTQFLHHWLGSRESRRILPAMVI